MISPKFRFAVEIYVPDWDKPTETEIVKAIRAESEYARFEKIRNANLPGAGREAYERQHQDTLKKIRSGEMDDLGAIRLRDSLDHETSKRREIAHGEMIRTCQDFLPLAINIAERFAVACEQCAEKISAEEEARAAQFGLGWQPGPIVQMLRRVPVEFLANLKTTVNTRPSQLCPWIEFSAAK